MSEVWKKPYLLEVIDGLNMLDKFWIEERESAEFVLIKVHHEEFVRGSEIRLLGGELPVEVPHVLAMTLERAVLR